MKKILSILTLLCAAIFVAKADSNPSFPGGEEALTKYIESNLSYPAAALDNGIEGVVNVAFAVKPDGSIGSIKITRMIDPDLEQEAIRLVKNMPAWTPADKECTPVEAVLTLPIKFSLPAE